VSASSVKEDTEVRREPSPNPIYIYVKVVNPLIPSFCMSSFWPKEEIQLYKHIFYDQPFFQYRVFFATVRQNVDQNTPMLVKESKTRQKRIVYPYFEY
jgi:hypothetical protein